MVCTFAARPFETDPGALKVPFFHNNDDYEEVIFYHAGDFFSRDNIHPGMMTFHPSGFTHGPHPKALTRMFQQAKPGTDEYAVMIDTRDALEPGAGAVAVEWTGYEYNHYDHGCWNDVVQFAVPIVALRCGENLIELRRARENPGFVGNVEVRKCILEIDYPDSFAPGRLEK